MANAKEIHQVVEAFELWRHNRGTRKSPTPQALRKQAVDLLEGRVQVKVGVNEGRGQVACFIILLVKRSISRLSNKSSSARFRI